HGYVGVWYGVTFGVDNSPAQDMTGLEAHLDWLFAFGRLDFNELYGEVIGDDEEVGLSRHDARHTELTLVIRLARYHALDLNPRVCDGTAGWVEHLPGDRHTPSELDHVRVLAQDVEVDVVRPDVAGEVVGMAGVDFG